LAALNVFLTVQVPRPSIRCSHAPSARRQFLCANQTSEGGYTVIAADIRGNAAVGGTRIPLFFVGDDHQVQVNAYGSDVSAVEGGPVRHPDPKHVRPIGSGLSYVAADGSRAEFKISDRLLKSSNLLSNQSFIIRTAAAIMSKKPWYTRFESPITLKLPGQSPHEGEGTLEFFELK
jgi:hypothetical protein